jgi:hypothetical protein
VGLVPGGATQQADRRGRARSQASRHPLGTVARRLELLSRQSCGTRPQLTKSHAASRRLAESCPQATTAATRVWLAALLLACSDDHVQPIAAWPTDTPSCVIANANSRLRQLLSTNSDELKTGPTAFVRTPRTDLPLTPAPPHSHELGRTLLILRLPVQAQLLLRCRAVA